ncbi:MAG: quinolinate synthase NadA [Candidatus Omnitrophica bacterium]|nr:quinolinate synthase NadA [Candidatus Omnitrophota bacterium]
MIDKALLEKIKKLKKERNAVILAHNYQIPEVQDMADFLGDSLGLSIKASKTKADIIVFCGVKFMAETAKIISPGKKVLIPEKDAGCPMADMITAEALIELKKKHPEAKVLSYVNTPAEVKAESDLLCTSANAVELVKKAFTPGDEIIFVPDKYLADYVSRETGRKFISWNGYCTAHVSILPEHVKEEKRLHPEAKVLVHPECTRPVIDLADEALSTEGMMKFAKKTSAKEMIIGTEPGIVYRLKKENPGKEFYAANASSVCRNMKKTTLNKVIRSLEIMQYEIILSDDIIRRAKKSIEGMLKFR